MSTNVITIAEIAEELGVKPENAARACRRLADTAGFPRSLPGLPSRFSRAQVEAWFRSGGAPAPAEPVAAVDDPAADLVTAARQTLEARYVDN